MPHNKHFTESEIQFIKDNYDKLSTKQIANHLDRTERSIRGKIERLGISLSSLQRNQPFQWTDKQLQFLKENYTKLSDEKMSKVLGISASMICRKRIELNLRIHKYEPFIVSEYVYQYIDGVRVPLHRHVVEQRIGRKLMKTERVHHINGDKTDYRSENLYLCSNMQEHGNVHNSLEKVAFDLVKSGVIKFDSENGCYYL